MNASAPTKLLETDTSRKKDDREGTETKKDTDSSSDSTSTPATPTTSLSAAESTPKMSTPTKSEEPVGFNQSQQGETVMKKQQPQPQQQQNKDTVIDISKDASDAENHNNGKHTAVGTSDATSTPVNAAPVNAVRLVHDAEAAYQMASPWIRTELDNEMTDWPPNTKITKAIPKQGTVIEIISPKTRGTMQNGVWKDPPTYNQKDSQYEEALKNWYQMLKQLKKAYRQHGSSKEVTDPKELGRLALWISRQRMFKYNLTGKQIEDLESIADPSTARIRVYLKKGNDDDKKEPEKILHFVDNFSWGYQRKGNNHRRWEECWDKLVEYKNEFGHVRVPIRWKRDATLGKWVSRQRDTAAQLSYERAFKLNELGFIWQCGNNTILTRKESEYNARMKAKEIAAKEKDKNPDQVFNELMEQERKRLAALQTINTQHRGKRPRISAEHQPQLIKETNDWKKARTPTPMARKKGRLHQTPVSQRNSKRKASTVEMQMYPSNTFLDLAEQAKIEASVKSRWASDAALGLIPIVARTVQRDGLIPNDVRDAAGPALNGIYNASYGAGMYPSMTMQQSQILRQDHHKHLMEVTMKMVLENSRKSNINMNDNNIITTNNNNNMNGSVDDYGFVRNNIAFHNNTDSVWNGNGTIQSNAIVQEDGTDAAATATDAVNYDINIVSTHDFFSKDDRSISPSAAEFDDGYHYSDNFYHLQYSKNHQQQQQTKTCYAAATESGRHQDGSMTENYPMTNAQIDGIFHCTKTSWRYGSATAEDPFSPLNKESYNNLKGDNSTLGVVPLVERSLKNFFHDSDSEYVEESAASSHSGAAAPKTGGSQNLVRSPIVALNSILSFRRKTKAFKRPITVADPEEESRRFAMACCHRMNPCTEDWDRKQLWRFVCK